MSSPQSRLELMSSDHFVVILHADKQHGLIFNRLDGTIATIKHDDAKELSNLKSFGSVYGIIGRYLSKYLVLIKNCSLVGTLYEPNTRTEHEIYVITQVQVVDTSCISTNDTPKISSVRYDAVHSKSEPISNESTNVEQQATGIQRAPSPDNEDFSSLPVTISTSSYNSMQSRGGPWNPFKLANSLKPRMPTQFIKSAGIDSSIIGDATGSSSGSSSHANNQSDESDKRLVEEMVKLFNNTNSFYFSPTLDLTNRFSRKRLVKNMKDEPIWKTADERFFWNKHMLKDLIEHSEDDNDFNYFVCVILQGFVAIENYTVPSKSYVNDSGVENCLLATSMNSMVIPSTTSSNYRDNNDLAEDQDRSTRKEQPISKVYKFALVSRRSVFHAGTRYRRRGCDEEGHCANFVESEQIFSFNHHFTSVVIIRGSIPLYWYQTGYNYRPPPVMFRSEEENHLAFSKHFKELIESYETDKIFAIDCTEHTGREKMLHDAYKRHFDRLKLTIPNVGLIEFDFHKHCRGRQCSDIHVEKHLRSCGLTDQLIKDARYYWNDGDVVWNQNAVFRVNCLDCSDRTNVVQRAIALQILDLQLSRLGNIAPDTCPEDNDCRRIMQLMWSSNGNVLSTQYCGTRALFTGERKLSGYLKDTYSSASRYYISKFRDAYRQAAIDAMLGIEGTVSGNAPEDSKDQNPGMDQYELINLDPIFAGRGGGALLKDVGNRVTNRLARLKGKFYVKPFGLVESMRYTANEAEDAIDEAEPEILEERVCEALDGMNIDWPSCESVENNDNQPPNVFAQLSNTDDSFQDDEFGQLMLSIDLAELQRLQGEDSSGSKNGGRSDKEKPEEIDMTEACGLKTSSSESNSGKGLATSTTST